MPYTFTSDWVTPHAKNWANAIAEMIGRPNILMIEIGSYEGRSAVWFLENVLTDISAALICIDPYVKEVFYENTALFKHKIRLIKQQSQKALRDPYFAEERADIIYIDGSHAAANVLEDAVLAFRTLKKNGVLIFDDYLWKKDGELSEPKIAIDAFLNIFRDKLTVIYKQYIVIIKKL